MKKKNILKKDWKFYLGIGFLILSFLLPLLGFAIPFLKLNVEIIIPLTAFLIVGGPEIMVVIAAAFLGKKFYTHFRNKLYSFFKRKKKPKRVSKTRYYFGLTIMLLSIVPFYLSEYLPQIFPNKTYEKNIIFFIADLSFVISFFILGGDFWEKFKKLFTYDELADK